MGLLELIVKTGIARAITSQLGGLKGNKNAIAETIENNVRRKIIKEHLSDPAYYETMSALLDEIISLRKSKAVEYEEYLKSIAELARKVEAGLADDTPEALKRSPALRALYNNVKVARATPSGTDLGTPGSADRATPGQADDGTPTRAVRATPVRVDRETIPRRLDREAMPRADRAADGPGAYLISADPLLDLALKLDAAVRRVRPDGWRGIQARAQVIKAALYDILEDETEVERLFLIVKAQGEY